MPRPRSGIKIFRPRPGVTISSVSDLVYGNILERAKKFKEITLGHTAIPDAKQAYFDDLTVLNNDIGANRTRYNSEYGQLAQEILCHSQTLLWWKPSSRRPVRACHL
jgi:hypothetical protein